MACKRTYRAVHDSGPRRRSDISLVVIHDTQGDTARGAAAWFANPASSGSAQVTVDDPECYRTVPDLVIPWAAVGANTQGLHLEFAGHAEWTRARWLVHKPMLRRGAHIAARWSITYAVPARRLHVEDLRAGRRGFTDHRTVEAWRPSTGHSDPGAEFPWHLWLGMVRAEIDALERS